MVAMTIAKQVLRLTIKPPYVYSLVYYFHYLYCKCVETNTHKTLLLSPQLASPRVEGVRKHRGRKYILAGIGEVECVHTSVSFAYW